MKKISISRKDLNNNLKIIRKKLYNFGKNDESQNIEIIAVVKENGMGLGLIAYSKFLINNGINILAVVSVDEAVRLRQAGIQEKILMLTPVINIKEAINLIKNRIILTISNEKQMQMIEKLAKKSDNQIEAHIKIDTGFGRYGFLYQDFEKILKVYKECNNIKLTRIIYTFL